MIEWLVEHKDAIIVDVIGKGSFMALLWYVWGWRPTDKGWLRDPFYKGE
jgi:hypothetical protein